VRLKSTSSDRRVTKAGCRLRYACSNLVRWCNRCPSRPSPLPPPSQQASKQPRSHSARWQVGECTTSDRSAVPWMGGRGRGVAPNCQSTPQYGVPPTKTRTPPTNNTRDGSYTNNPTPGSARNLLLLHRLRGTRQVHAPSPYHRPDDCPSRSLESVFDDCLLEPTDALMDTSTGTSMAASTAASTAAPAGASTGALRRRNVPLAKMQGIPVAAIRRLARRGGVNDSRSSVAASGSSLRK